MDVGALCRRHHAGGPSVQTVDQVERGPLPQMVQQSRRQGGLPGDQGGRDTGQRRGLIHYQEVFVLEKDIQGHGHGGHIGGTLCCGQVYHKAVPLTEDGVGEDAGTVGGETSLGTFQAADEGGGETKLPAQQALYRPAGQLMCDLKLQRRHKRPRNIKSFARRDFATATSSGRAKFNCA